MVELNEERQEIGLRCQPTHNNFGFLYDSINLRKSYRLKKVHTKKKVIRTGSYLAKTILLSKLF